MVTRSSARRLRLMSPERSMVADRMRSVSSVKTDIGTTETKYQLPASSNGR